MVVANMDSPLRDQVLKLMDEKTRIEREIQDLNAVLETNQIGLHEPLVDEAGYPRSDIDVFQVRHARHRIICLQNDHTALMKQIEKGLHALHARAAGGYREEHMSIDSTLPSTTAANVENGNERLRNSEEGVALVTTSTQNMSVSELPPFVKVNFVSDGSPAETAGIRVEDQILQFGSISAQNFRALNQIGELVQHSVGRKIPVKIKRDDHIINATLIPAAWSGRGLLGCNIIPV